MKVQAKCIFRIIFDMYRPEICLQFFVYNPVFTLHLILSLCHHIQAELGSAEEQPNKE